MTLKAIEPKDRLKLIVLVLAAFCVFGYSAFQTASYDNQQKAMVAAAQQKISHQPVVVAANTGAQPAGTLPSVVPTVGQVTPGTSTTPGGLTGPRSGIAGVPVIATTATTVTGPPTGGKDPFQPSGRFAPAPPSPTPAPQRLVMATPLPAAKPTSGGPIFTPLTPMPGPAPVAPVVMPPPAPPAYTVTGVVVADRDNPGAAPIAVLRGGAGAGDTGNGKLASTPTMTASSNTSERRFVTIGDPVGNGFVVAAVRADGVDLRSGKRLVTLKIGTANGNLK